MVGTICHFARQLISVTFAVTVPMMRQCRVLTLGEPLIFESTGRASGKKRRELNWKPDVSASSQAKKNQANSKATAEV